MSKKKDKKVKKKDEQKSEADSNRDDETSNVECSNILRSLTVIYGFFFVFMSAMVAGAQNLRAELNLSDALVFYLFVFILALACYFIGVEIYRILVRFGISHIGEWGISLIVILVPTIFIFVIGQALLTEMVVFGVKIAPYGIYVVSGSELLITSILLWQQKKDN